jgi:tetratricopeptide (TPR) repeat protein
MERNRKVEKNEKLLIRALRSRGGTYFDIGDYKSAMNDYLFLKNMYENNLKVKIESLFRIGFIFERLGNHKKADFFYNRVYQIATRNKLPFWQGKALIGSSFIRYLAGNFNLGLKIANKSLNFFTKIHTKNKKIEDEIQETISSLYDVIGSILLEHKDYKESINIFKKGLEVNKKLGDKLHQAMKWNNIGVVYRRQEKFKQALRYYMKALKVFRELGAQNDIASTMNNIGLTYNYLGDYEISLMYLKQSLEKLEILGVKRGASYALHNIGNVYANMRKYKGAYQSYRRSLEIKLEIGDEFSAAKTYRAIADVDKKLGRYKKAIENLNHSTSLLKKVNNKEEMKANLIEILKLKKVKQLLR